MTALNDIFPFTCRCCTRCEVDNAQNTLKLQSLYTSPPEAVMVMSVAEIFAKNTKRLVISPTDELPQMICLSCVEKVLQMQKFLDMCMESEKNMRWIMKNAKGPTTNKQEIFVKEELELEECAEGTDFVLNTFTNDETLAEDSETVNDLEMYNSEQQTTMRCPPNVIVVNETTTHFDFDEHSQKAKNDLKKLLRLWGHEDLFDIFIINKIDIETLEHVSETDLGQIFLNKPLGMKIDFRQKLKTWRVKERFGNLDILTHKTTIDDIAKNVFGYSSAQNAFHNSNVNLDETLIETQSPVSLVNFNLENIIRNYPGGNDCFLEFEKKNCISDGSRNTIVKSIIQWANNGNMHLNRRDFDFIVTQIKRCFNDNTNLYYSKPINGNGSPSGLLYNKYNYCRRRLKKIGMLSANSETTNNNDCNNLSNNEANQDAPKDQIWLKVHKEPWDEVKIKWTNMYNYRNKQINQMNTDAKLKNILYNWPLFEHNYGFELINIDFALKFPEKEDNLLLKWKHFKEKIVGIFNLHVRHPSSLAQLKALNGKAFSEVPEDVLIFDILHAILSPTMKRTAEGHKKYTIKDSQRSFLLKVEEISNFYPCIEEAAKEFKSLQPIIVYVISENCYIVSFDKLKYKFDNLMLAIDTCFKVFHVFNLKFPEPCYLVWLFIQYYFFEIVEKNTKIPLKVTSLSESLKLVSST